MKPYEKFKTLGPGALSQEELLSIILRTGTAGKDALALAHEVCSMLPGGNLTGLYHVSLQRLCEISGIGEVKAIKLQCVAELARRISITTAEKRLLFNQPETVARYYMESLRHMEQEMVVLIMLDSRLQRIDDQIISIGTIHNSAMSPREIIRVALNKNAAQIMLLHNHPSGDATPSKQDIEITHRMYNACVLMDIPLTDHIVIGDNTYVSMRQSGVLVP